MTAPRNFLTKAAPHISPEDMEALRAQPKECDQCGRLYNAHPRFSYDQWVTSRFCSRKCAARKNGNARWFKSGVAREAAAFLVLRKQREESMGVLHLRIPVSLAGDGAPVFRIKTCDHNNVIVKRIELRISTRRHIPMVDEE